MTEHELKAWPEHYAAIDAGHKTCELRLNDRPYRVGDALLLREWEPVENGYTGKQLRVRVTHVLSGGPWLSPGYVAMSIRLMGDDGNARAMPADAIRAERERIAGGCQAQKRRRVKDDYDRGWNDALDVIGAAIRS